MTAKINNPDEISVAIIGAGYIAREHIRAFRDIDGVCIKGIYSRTASKARQLADEFNIEMVSPSVDELFEVTNAHLVVICVNVESIEIIAAECFAYPWTVLIEKPAGRDLPSARALLEIAKKTGSNAFVALNRRFYSSTRLLSQELNHIDEPRFIEIMDQEDQFAAREQSSEIVANLLMFANSLHLIDLAFVFARGRVAEVQNIVPWTQWTSGVLLSAITFTSGDKVIYKGHWNQPGPWSVSIATPQVYFEMRPLEDLAKKEGRDRVFKNVELHEWDKEFKPGLRLQAEHAVRAVRGQKHGLVSLHASLRTMALVDQIFNG